MKYRKNTVKWMAATAFVGAALSAQAVLIGSESFQSTNSDPAGYTAKDPLAMNPSNFKVVVGNSGFSANQPWANAAGDIIADGWGGMVHSGVTGSALAGCIRLRSNGSQGYDRNSTRMLDPLPSASSTYYLSGLARFGKVTNLEEGQEMSVGFKHSTSDFDVYEVDNGMHFGSQMEGGVNYFTASAGGSTYNLMAGTVANEAAVFQIVLKLDVDAAGTDTLTAWYAADGDTALTQGLAPTSVESWTGANDLRMLVVQGNTTGYNIFGNRFDEVRLGTELSDVTTIPEPATLGLMGLAFAGIFASRRFSM